VVRRCQGDRHLRGENLEDLNFRGGDYGKFLWTVDGVDYARYYLPPTARNLDSTPEQIIAQMDYLGISKGIVQGGHTYGRLNEYLGGVVRQYPERLYALASIREWMADDPAVIAELRSAVEDHGLTGLFFDTASVKRAGRSELSDDPVFDEFRGVVRELGIPVFWNVTSASSELESWMEQHAAFGRWLERYPDIACVYTHGIPLYRFWSSGKLEFISELGFERVELGVIAANSGARRFYEAYGWVLVRTFPKGIEGVPVAIYELS